MELYLAKLLFVRAKIFLGQTIICDSTHFKKCEVYTFILVHVKSSSLLLHDTEVDSLFQSMIFQ